MNISIKRIRKTYKNLILLKNLDNICFPDDYSPPFGMRKFDCWFLYIKNDIVAYASGYKWKDFYFLARGGVLPKWRGQSLQQSLIKERIKKAKSLEVDHIITYTSADNIPSIKNLKACGFKEWIDAPEWFAKSSNDFLFWHLDASGDSKLF